MRHQRQTPRGQDDCNSSEVGPSDYQAFLSYHAAVQITECILK